jgi:hypothetical protein
MALIAQDINHVREYSLMEDTSDDKTIFLIGVIDTSARAYIDDTHSIYKKDSAELDDVALHNKYIQFVRFGLKGWKNLKTTDGNEAEFKTVEELFPRIGKRIVISNDSLNYLPLKAIIELGIQIVSENYLKAADQKNL